MSTKTIYKRIALVAVAALGAGVLSVAPASAASVLVNELTFVAAATQPGVCAIDPTSGAQGAVVVSGSTVTMSLTQASGTDDLHVTVAGNATIASATSGFEAVTLTTATNASAGTTGQTITFRAGAVGSATITLRENATASAFEVAGITVVASCANNVLNLANSFIEVGALETPANDNIDDAAYTTVNNTATTYINVLLRDAYLADLTGAGVLLATATNGAVIAWNGAPTVQSSTAFLNTRGVANTALYVTQGLANANKPLTTTVTITLDGVAVTTKTLTFRGVAANIKITGVGVGKVGSTGTFDAQVLDAAGVALLSQTVATDSANDVSAVAAIANINTSAVTGSLGQATSATVGTRGLYGCVKSGTTTLTVKVTISAIAGTSVSQTFPVICGDVLDTWTVSMDKATYAPGEIATLTVSGKDSKGFAVNSTDTLGAGLAYSFGGMTAVTAPTEADKFSSAAGAKTYQFSVGTSEGSFVGTFKITGATDTAAKTVQYKIAGAAGVSNADVLKAIVSLIASINKQIAALQKALLRR